MSKIVATETSGEAFGRHVVAVGVGAALVLIGLIGFFLMLPSATAGTLSNGAVMSTGLGVQFFAGLLLIAYGTLMGRK